MKLRSKIQSRLLASTVFASAALVATPAFAQSQSAAAGDEGDQAIVVTGTLVRNPNLVSSNPVNVVGEEEIELQQANVAEELLRELPGAVPSIGSAVNNGNGGASYVDLRGLGSFRNIVLLDGARIAPSGLLGRVDLNNIPLALVQRVEVLTGGASTTYGADAVSGVVNFITRRDFSGIDINVSEQITQRGDGNTLRADVTIGANFDDGRGNAVLSLGYQEADPVYQGARDYSIFQADSFTGAPGGSGTAVPSRFTGVNTTLAGCGGPGEPTCATAQGNRQVNDAGTAFLPTAAFTAFNFNPYNVFQTPFERFNIYGAARYEVSDAIEVYTRALFSKNTVETIIAPSGAFGISVVIPLSNPFLTTAQRNAFCAFDTTTGAGYTPLYTPAQCAAAATATSATDPNFRTVTTVLSRRAIEAGPRTSTFVTTIFDYRAGARGGITDSIDWDVSGAYGESENVSTTGGYTLNSRVRSAVYATNTTSCLANAPQGSTTAGCVPANFFGPGGAISQAAVAYLVGNSTVLTRTSLAQARGLISGDFGWNIPWAAEPVSFAVGAEYRAYNASQQSDTLAQSGDLGGAGGAAPNIVGAYDVYEGYGELIVPIVSDRPFFDELTLEAGVRYSSYNVDGGAIAQPSYNTTTWKVAGTWAPIDGLRFRGNYQRAIRAPTIAELFSPQNTTLTNLSDDPCANLADNGTLIPGRPVPTGELRAICLAQGAPAGAIGAIGVPTAGQANTTGGGNLLLTPEKSTSWTAGVVFQPDFVPGLSLSLDYYDIEITRAVSAPTPADAITACFGPGTGLTPAAGASTTDACTIIRRNPVTGQLSGDPATTPGLFQALSNLGFLHTNGVDFTANYRHDFNWFGGMGLAFNFVLNWTDTSEFEAVEGISGVRDCVGLYSANCPSIQPEWQWSLRTTATFDNIDVSLLWRHIDAVSYEFGPGGDNSGPAFSGTLGAGLGVLSGRAVDFNEIPSADYFDLTTRFQVDDHLTITLSVQNLFDKQPPITGNTLGSTSYNSGNTYPSSYDTLGRRFAVAARIRF